MATMTFQYDGYFAFKRILLANNVCDPIVAYYLEAF